MKAIIHAGMSKTGSSSIQQTFVKLDHPDILYPGSGNGNHSALTALLFNKEPHNYPGFKARGLTEGALLLKRAKTKKEIIQEITSSSANVFILSSEQISSMPRGVLRKIKNFADNNFDEHQVIAYVRPPIGYMTSVFQQRLKSRLTTLELVWPKYRKRFEAIDEVFGRENVSLKKFDREFLMKSDVVSDFAHYVGIEVDEDRIVRSNESLSLEASALLFVQRRFGQGFVRGTPRSVDENFAFTRRLMTLGDKKLRFSKKLLSPILEANKEDLDWIEERLGLSILDATPQGETLISSEDDLIKAAWRANPHITNLLPAAHKTTKSSSLEDLVSNVELLREMAAKSVS